MKSERRHDLETNELVIWLEKFKPYVGQATAVVAVLVAAMAISTIWSNDNKVKEQAAWDAFAMASNTTDPELMGLLSVADDAKYAGTSMPEWANVTWADRQLQLAGQAYLADRDAAFSRLEKIEGIYQTLSKDSGDRTVRNRALYGLARVYELQNKLDEAKSTYASVQGDLATLATQRAERLDMPEVQEVCAWLATAELPKRATTGGPGVKPSFDAQLPSAGGDEFDTQALEKLLGNLTNDSGSTQDRYSETKEDTAEETTEEDSDSEAATEGPARKRSCCRIGRGRLC